MIPFGWGAGVSARFKRKRKKKKYRPADDVRLVKKSPTSTFFFCVPALYESCHQSGFSGRVQVSLRDVLGADSFRLQVHLVGPDLAGIVVNCALLEDVLRCSGDQFPRNTDRCVCRVQRS